MRFVCFAFSSVIPTSLIYDNINLIQNLISYWPTLEKEEPPDGALVPILRLTSYNIASKKGQPRAGPKEEKSHGTENSLCLY